MLVNVFIIGIGMIGGSLGLSLKESPIVNQVMGYDTDKTSLEKAQQIGALDCSVPFEEGARQADVVFLCTPPGTYPELITRMRPFLKPGCIVTDTGSTKQYIMSILGQLPDDIHVIGGHPMAGSEIKGINGADRYLFENAVYILTPREKTPDYAREFLIELLVATGARVKIMEPARHDELVAVISHIPHLAAVALVNSTGGEKDALIMAAGGFRDTTRIASSDPLLWEDILFTNRNMVMNKLDGLIEQLQDLKLALAREDHEHINTSLCRARSVRESIPRVHRGLLPGFCDIVCIVPDRPGIIAHIGAILGEKNINIIDIEILRVREGDGGTIRLGVLSEAAADEAVKALQSRGIKAWVR